MNPVHAFLACLLAAPVAAQTTQRVTVVPHGNPADTGGGITQTHAISGDGRFVVFESTSTSYVPGDPFNPWWDVFVRDRTTEGSSSKASPPTGRTGTTRASAP